MEPRVSPELISRFELMDRVFAKGLVIHTAVPFDFLGVRRRSLDAPFVVEAIEGHEDTLRSPYGLEAFGSGDAGLQDAADRWPEG
jgi:hypothetical protein